MIINAETLYMRISRLRRKINEGGSIPSNATDDIKHILRTAPKLLYDLEALREDGDSELFEKLHVALGQAEQMIEYALGTIYAKKFGEECRAGKETDSSLPADKRLLERMTRFMLTKIAGPQYIELVKEFAGEDAVQGTTVYMDPTEESEAFVQWMMHDINLPGQSKRFIDLFAKSEMAKLPQDEQDLLKARQADRPSIYKVIEIYKEPEKINTYLVQDLLSPEVHLHIHDKSTSKSLRQGAIFMGRAIPFVGSAGLYQVMGAISEYPPKLWILLYNALSEWDKKFYKKHPGSTSQEFFRSHHSKLRKKMREIVEAHRL